MKIAGSGPEKNRRQLEELSDRLNISGRVKFLGRISDEEKKDFLANALFLVMPSRFEGWGITAIEANACGKAVIGTKIPGLQDAVKNGETGLLVESENINELTHAIDRLLGDTGLGETLGESGKEWAKNFKWKSIAEKQEEFYNSVLRAQAFQNKRNLNE